MNISQKPPSVSSVAGIPLDDFSVEQLQALMLGCAHALRERESLRIGLITDLVDSLFDPSFIDKLRYEPTPRSELLILISTIASRLREMETPLEKKLEIAGDGFYLSFEDDEGKRYWFNHSGESIDSLPSLPCSWEEIKVIRSRVVREILQPGTTPMAKLSFPRNDRYLQILKKSGEQWEEKKKFKTSNSGRPLYKYVPVSFNCQIDLPELSGEVEASPHGLEYPETLVLEKRFQERKLTQKEISDIWETFSEEESEALGDFGADIAAGEMSTSDAVKIILSARVKSKTEVFSNESSEEATRRLFPELFEPCKQRIPLEMQYKVLAEILQQPFYGQRWEKSMPANANADSDNVADKGWLSDVFDELKCQFDKRISVSWVNKEYIVVEQSAWECWRVLALNEQLIDELKWQFATEVTGKLNRPPIKT